MKPRNRDHTTEDEGQTVVDVKDGNVLVAMEQRHLVSEFGNALRPRYNVWTTTSGRQALDIVDNEVDVIAVTPETTDMTGAAVVSETRKRGVDCKAVVVGGEDNGRFDGRIRTPVTEEAIAETVEGMTEGDENGVHEGWLSDGNPVAEDYENWAKRRVTGFGKSGVSRFEP